MGRLPRYKQDYAPVLSDRGERKQTPRGTGGVVQVPVPRWTSSSSLTQLKAKKQTLAWIQRQYFL